MKPELRFDLGADIDAVGVDVPIENDVAAAGQRQGLALESVIAPCRDRRRQKRSA